MYTNRLATDFWEGVRCETNAVLNRSWENIEAAIKNLDGKYRTTVAIEGNEPTRLGVGGGKGGQYVVWATFDNMHFHTLMSAEQSDTKIMLCIGGQEGDYEENIVVDLTVALQAAKTFAESGQLDPRLKWRDE